MLYEVITYDAFRDSELEYLGYNILRIKNEELTNIEIVLKKIDTYLKSINNP